jgi:PKD repeat protein
VDWRGEYFNNLALTGAPVLVRNDAAINFNWGAGSPSSLMPADNFSVRWSRTLDFPAGLYRFYAKFDDGLRLYVDDALLIDAWQDGPSRQLSVERQLSGGSHRLRLEYYEHTGDAVIQTWWERVDAASYPDWKGEYWSNSSLSGSPALVRNEVTIDFNWGYGWPGPGLPVDQFSARWSRTWYFSEGAYRFHAIVDDGLRLYVDDSLVIDSWRDGSQRELIADRWLWDGVHTLRVEYYENVGQAVVKVWAEKISSSGGSNDEPEAKFDAGPRSGPAPLKVRFDNNSDGNYDDCKWYFGDGDTSDDCGDPRHTYTEPGTYEVKLRVRGDNGSDTEKKRDYITVYGLPVANFTIGPTSGLAPLTVNFTNTSTNYTDCIWAFGDGGTTTACNPGYTYTAPGTYSVNLLVSGPGGTAVQTCTNCVTVTTIVTPVVKFVAQPQSGPAPLEVTFTNHTLGDGLTFAWDFGDGATSTERDPGHTYTSPGSFAVSLTATAPGGGTDTVSRAAFITVTDGGIITPVVKFVAQPQSGPAPLDVAFTNHTLGDGLTFAWDFGDGATSTERDPGHTYTSPGSFAVSLTATAPGGGTDTVSRAAFITVTETVTTAIDIPPIVPTATDPSPLVSDFVVESTPTTIPATDTPLPPTETATPIPPTTTATPTPLRETATPIPPTETATPLPPTSTPEPPTATPVSPTSTPEPPTATPVPPTSTPVPPAAPPTVTPVPAPAPPAEPSPTPSASPDAPPATT